MQKEIIEYKILAEVSYRCLVRSVKEDIKSGWQPFGSFTVGGPSRYFYHQVMVKYLETEVEDDD